MEGLVGAWTATRPAAGGSLERGPLTLFHDRLVFGAEVEDGLSLPIGGIDHAEVLGRGSLFKPPQLRLHLADGRQLDLGILYSPNAPNASERNRDAFDDFVSKLPVPVR
jgi:hypothetical protein